MLSAGDRPIAFWSGAGFNGTFFVGTPGYDPAFAEYSIGTYLLLRVIEDSDRRRRRSSRSTTGFGESEYKRRFGSESWEEEDVLIFAPTVRGVRINATRTAVGGHGGARTRRRRPNGARGAGSSGAGAGGSRASATSPVG